MTGNSTLIIAAGAPAAKVRRAQREAPGRHRKNSPARVLELAESLDRYPAGVEARLMEAIRGLADSYEDMENRVLAAEKERQKGLQQLHKLEDKVENLTALTGVFSSILDAIPAGILVYDDEKRICYVNPFIARVIGKTRAEIIGKTSAETGSGHGLMAEIEGGIESVFQSGKVVKKEFRCSRPGEGARMLDATIVPLKRKDKTVQEAAVICYDVTQQKERENELKRLNDEMAIINETIRMVNSSLDLNEMLGKVISTILTSLKFDAGWIYLKNTGGNYAQLVASQGVPGSFFIDQKTVIMRDHPYNIIFYAGVPRFVENNPDSQPGMSDCKILEAADAIAYAGVPLMADTVVLGVLYLARRTVGKISRSERQILQSIGKEIGGTIFRGMLQQHVEDSYDRVIRYLDFLSHDISEANHVIGEQAQAIRQILDGPAVRFVDVQVTQVHIIRELIENVTLLRRLPVKETPGPIDLDSVVAQLKEKFPSVRIEYEESGVTVVADEFIGDIFTNLVGNSVKFGGPGVEVRIQAEEQGGEVDITVADTGPGLSEERKAQLFSSPQYPRKSPCGKGMGMYVIRRLVDRYGGRVNAEDRVPGTPAEGVCIRITLPAFTGPGESSAWLRPECPQGAIENCTVRHEDETRS